MNRFDTTGRITSQQNRAQQDPSSDESTEDTNSAEQDPSTPRDPKRRRVNNSVGKKGKEKCADCRRLKKKVTFYHPKFSSYSDLVRLH